MVQWVALLNRAIFWFHPLAWWLERRLSALAEEACDDAVLKQGQDPVQYLGISTRSGKNGAASKEEWQWPEHFYHKKESNE